MRTDIDNKDAAVFNRARYGLLASMMSAQHEAAIKIFQT